MNIFKNWKIVTNYLTRIMLFINICLMVMMYIKISKPQKMLNFDTPKIKIEYKSPDLQIKSNFLYFKGIKIGSSKLINDNYSFDSTWPREIWDGYITLFDGESNGKYWIWSKNKINENTLDGWFFVPKVGKLQYTSGYCNMIIPVVKRIN